MTRVMASGVFDILHTGHISYLEQAKALGDELVVVVACDDTVRTKKHEPVTPENMRLRIVSSIRSVDMAILGKQGDMFGAVKELRPDIIALGFDQDFKEEELMEGLKRNGLEHIEVIRVTECAEDLAATRRIISRIRGSKECEK